ncbi:MAG: phoR [Chloroflexi bacterium]|nr:phoR [Chloroflexota bacterium]
MCAMTTGGFRDIQPVEPDLVNSVMQSAALLATILVAHAESQTRLQICRALQDEGYKVLEGVASTDTLSALDAHIPDLLIVGFPGSDAITFLQSIHHHPVRAAVALLALDMGGEAVPLLEAGADDVLAMPLNTQGLRLKVHSLLRMKVAERTARELVSRRSRDQQSLQRASQRLAACRRLSDVLTVTAEVLRANLGFDRVSIALYEQDTYTLRYAVSTDSQGRVYSPQDTPVAVVLSPGSQMLELPAYQSLFVDRQETYYIPDTGGRAPAYFRPFLDGPVGETLLVALRVGDQDVGLVTVDNLLSGRKFGPEDAGLLLTLGRQVALAIERARLADELEARAREAEVLAQVGATLSSVLEPAQLYDLVLEQAAKTLPFDMAAVLLYRDGWATVAASWGDPGVPADTRLWPLGEPMKSWLPEDNRPPVYIRDTDANIGWLDQEPWLAPHQLRSLISVPISAEGKVVGTFVIAGFAANFYSQRQVGLAAAFGDRIGQALRNANLYVAERERARASEELMQLRTSFVESVSHELRTPLTAILGYAEILQAHWNGSTDESRLEWVEKIAAAASRQQRLVEDLLLLTRVEGGEVGPRIERVHLKTIAQRAAEEVQASYRGQRIDLVGSEHLAVLADPGRALQIVTNLMDNAAKYSPEGSPIIVWWGPEDNTGSLRVLDRGPGVPSNGRDHLFTRFGRVPGSRMRAGRVGTGLGLYLGKGLATAMGGELDLESTGSEGSTFRLRLPLARD